MTETMHVETAKGSREFIALMAVMMSVVAISIDATLPALGVIGADLQVTNPNQAQYIISFIFAGMAIGQLICGPLSDAIGRKRIIYGSVFLYLIGSVICFLSQTIEMMLVGRFVQGLGVAGPYVSTMSIVRDKYSGRAMGRIMSLVMMIFIMTPAIAPSLGQGILYIASWHYIFALYIVYALLVLTWVGVRLEETLAPENRIPFSVKNIIHGVKEVFSHRAAVCYMFAIALIFGAMIGYLNSSQQIFQVQFAVGDKFALYFGGLALTFGIASLSNSRFVERLGMRYLATRAIGLILIASLIFFVMHQFVAITLWMFIAYASCLFFAMGFLFGNLNALAMEPMGHIAGIASAIIGSTSSVISIFLGTLIGQLYDNTLIPMTLGYLVLGSMSLGFLMLAQRKQA